MPVKKPAPAQAPAGFDLGNLSAYSSGYGMPEGNYAIVDITIKMFAPQVEGKTYEERLGAMVTYRPLNDGEDVEQFYSMGSKSHESWQPNDEGKGIVAVVGGPGKSPNASTNWAVLVKSLFDAGLPQGVFSNDVSVLEGTHVHVQNVAEPESRKSFKAATGEAAQEDKPRQIPIVSEIMEDGKPWEGTGGVPDAAEVAPAPTKAGKPNGKPAPVKVAPKATPAAEPEEEAAEETGDADDDTLLINAASTVLEKNPNGIGKLQLRTGMFPLLTKASDASKANALLKVTFATDAALANLLGGLGYQVVKGEVKPA